METVLGNISVSFKAESSLKFSGFFITQIGILRKMYQIEVSVLGLSGEAGTMRCT